MSADSLNIRPRSSYASQSVHPTPPPTTAPPHASPRRVVAGVVLWSTKLKHFPAHKIFSQWVIPLNHYERWRDPGERYSAAAHFRGRVRFLR
jgi:hypothetical protein